MIRSVMRSRTSIIILALPCLLQFVIGLSIQPQNSNDGLQLIQVFFDEQNEESNITRTDAIAAASSHTNKSTADQDPSIGDARSDVDTNLDHNTNLDLNYATDGSKQLTRSQVYRHLKVKNAHQQFDPIGTRTQDCKCSCMETDSATISQCFDSQLINIFIPKSVENR